MRFTRHCFLLATVLCLAMPATGLAGTSDGPVFDAVDHVAIGGRLGTAVLDQAPGGAAVLSHGFETDVAELVDVAVAKAVPLLAARAAAQAPAPTVAEAPSGILGLLAGVDVGVWATLLATLFGGIIGLFAKGARTRKIVTDAALSAWVAVEKWSAMNPDLAPAKAQLALAKFYEALAGQGVTVTPALVASAGRVWETQSAADKLARLRAEAAAKAAGPVGPQTPPAAS